ncbi:hypothetical protein M3A96_00695 [Helcobacillus massiliensis]|uniref:hypothetical protein n=1 Tax=Helcobacillus massiliensis TaxID=521392 RepID=UPI0021A919D4|nr:hypothetical protein [Helcobacillus massiliensis]MCT1556647.1 hypothetical protein [Helcobacillus massiliensis]MCT2035841.1 hypothetical protein [Helcobacillus massiliensis]MCT2331077.1 hypothetical protein [Helcobacillus massiliensis]
MSTAVPADPLAPANAGAVIRRARTTQVIARIALIAAVVTAVCVTVYRSILPVVAAGLSPVMRDPNEVVPTVLVITAVLFVLLGLLTGLTVVALDVVLLVRGPGRVRAWAAASLVLVLFSGLVNLGRLVADIDGEGTSLPGPGASEAERLGMVIGFILARLLFIALPLFLAAAANALAARAARRDVTAGRALPTSTPAAPARPAEGARA